MRRICVALALLALAGCGGGDYSGGGAEPRTLEDSPVVTREEELLERVGTGGSAAPPPPDVVAIRLNRICRRTQARLEEGSGAADEIAVLRKLGQRLLAADIDQRRHDARKEYVELLSYEIEVDELIARAAKAGDETAVDDLNEQKRHTRGKRRDLAREILKANRCRPGDNLTD